MTRSNLDPHTLHQFSQMAHNWWDPQGVCKPLHAINPVRLEFILKQLKVPAKGQQAIDIGCGGGILTEALAKKGVSMTGIDPSAELIEVAKTHAISQDLAIRYVLSTAEDFLDIYQGAFSVLTCMELLEHVPNPAKLIKTCSQLTQPGGHLFFSTINRHPKAWLMAILGAEYLLGWLPRGTHQYEAFIKPSELAAAGRQANLDLVCCAGIRYHPLSAKWHLSQAVDVNYLVHFQKPQ